MANDSNNPGDYASRPVVRLDGQPQPNLSDPQLYSLVVEETTLGLFRCEARFNNWGFKKGTTSFLYFDRDLFDFGKPISFDLGPPNATRTVFSGRITAIEAQFPATSAPQITILAEDRFLDLRMRR